MRVVGGKERRAYPSRDVDQVRQDASLRFNPVIGDLDEEVVLTEDVLISGRGGERTIEVPG